MPGAAVIGYPHALPVTIAFAERFALAVPLALDQSIREPYRHFAREQYRHFAREQYRHFARESYRRG